MAAASSPRVSVIIPVFNAEATLAETLRSVVAQSFEEFEVVIVDDGSTDRTLQLATQFCRQDKRARLIQQERGGVAQARNLGIAASTGDYVAPLDADDLWHPDKLHRQVQVLDTSSPSVALVYNWFRKIDETGRVVEPPFMPAVQGRVLEQHLAWNFIGTASTPMFRRAVFERCSYDSRLYGAGNQGCEDFLLQLQVAMTHDFALIPAFLTGYRRSKAAMSQDTARMVRSHIQMFNILFPQLDGEVKRIARSQWAWWLSHHALIHAAHGEFSSAPKDLIRALTSSPISAVKSLGYHLAKRFAAEKSSDAHPLIGAQFEDLAMDEGNPDAKANPSARSGASKLDPAAEALSR